MKSKIIDSEQLKKLLYDGMSIMIGGFMANGTPEKLIDLVIESNVKDLVLYCNDAGYSDRGIGRIIANGQCKTLYASHIGLNPYAQQLMNENKLQIILIPQGTLAEQIRAGGAGLGGILTPTGIGTLVAQDKQVIEIKGKEYLLEEAIVADLALIKANYADVKGNAKLLGTTINFNPLMALAAKTVMLEAKKIVEHLDPNEVTIPNVVVDYIVKGED